MKRDEVLIPLSRQHHQMLILAQVLKLDVPNYKNMPKNEEEKFWFLKDKLKHLIVPNFKIHKDVLYPALVAWGFSEIKLLERIKEEENRLLSDINAITSANEGAMNEIGVSLEQLVRLRERQLYQKIQNECSEQLQQLKIS